MTTRDHVADVPPPSLRLAGTRWALAVTLGVGGGAAATAALAAGAAAVRGTAVGTGLVCCFFLFGALNAGVAAAYAPRWSMAIALLTYLMQVVGLGLVLVWMARRDIAPEVLDPGWLGGTVIAGTLAWTGALLVRALRDPEVQR